MSTSPDSNPISSSVFLSSCFHSESLNLMGRQCEVGRMDPLGSVQVPHQMHTEHMQIRALALHKSPPSLLGFPKCCKSQSLQKIPLQILLFHQQQNLLSILFYLPSSWEEFGLKCLLESTWWEQQAWSTPAARRRSAQTAVPQHSSFHPKPP